jgi:antirestriction protein ArdC
VHRSEKQDIYTRITNQIVSHLEKGVRPWVRPWNAEHAAGRITRPLRHNGKPYSGINVLSLWASAMAQNFAAPIWMTFKQASELDAHIRKSEVLRNTGSNYSTRRKSRVLQHCSRRNPDAAIREFPGHQHSYYTTLAHECTHNAASGIMPR